MRARRIDIPKHIRGGIRHRSKGFPERLRMFAFDVETCLGKPITIQLAESADDADILWVDESNILKHFVSWIEPKLLKKQVNVAFAHNLAFDLTALLYGHLDHLKSSCVTFEAEGVEMEVLSGKIFYCKMKFACGTVLHLIDTFRFFTTSLARIGKSIGAKNVKEGKPKGLGTTKYKKTDMEFIEYALADARLGYEVGERVIEMHRAFDVQLSISAPQFASRVFTKHFLKEGEEIALPSKMVCHGALASYHGGKNGFYVKPGMYRDCTEIDISSAYPDAMRRLPQFLEGEYRQVMEYKPGATAVWCVTGDVKPCRYPVFQTHEGKHIFGPTKVERLWVTCYELDEAVSRGEFDVKRCTGWEWVEKPGVKSNPLVRYVDEFYAKKESTPKTDPMYITYKLLLNSLYGKFIQNLEQDGEDGADVVLERTKNGTLKAKEKVYRAGGLFQPFIASLITGYVRAHLHRMEHDYEAVHSSTDSIKTMRRIDPDALPKGLGGHNIEVVGDCVLLRNKLYLHYDGASDLEQTPKKYALHGFWGNCKELLGVVRTRDNRYEVEHLYRLKEARKQKLVPLRSYIQKREVNIDWSEWCDHTGGGEETPGGVFAMGEARGMADEGLGRFEEPTARTARG